jgi:hypothetical protein
MRGGMAFSRQVLQTPYDFLRELKTMALNFAIRGWLFLQLRTPFVRLARQSLLIDMPRVSHHHVH